MALSGSRVKAQLRLSLSSTLCLQLLRERESGKERGRAAEREREVWQQSSLYEAAKWKRNETHKYLSLLLLLLSCWESADAAAATLRNCNLCGRSLPVARPCVCACVCLVPATVSASDPVTASACSTTVQPIPTGFLACLPVLRCSGFVIGRATSCCKNNSKATTSRHATSAPWTTYTKRAGRGGKQQRQQIENCRANSGKKNAVKSVAHTRPLLPPLSPSACVCVCVLCIHICTVCVAFNLANKRTKLQRSLCSLC